MIISAIMTPASVSATSLTACQARTTALMTNHSTARSVAKTLVMTRKLNATALPECLTYKKLWGKYFSPKQPVLIQF